MPVSFSTAEPFCSMRRLFYDVGEATQVAALLGGRASTRLHVVTVHLAVSSSAISEDVPHFRCTRRGIAWQGDGFDVRRSVGPETPRTVGLSGGRRTCPDNSEDS